MAGARGREAEAEVSSVLPQSGRAGRQPGPRRRRGPHPSSATSQPCGSQAGASAQGLQLRLRASVSPSITWDDDSSVPQAPCPAPSSPAYPEGVGHVQPPLHPHGSSPELLRASLSDSRQGEGRKGPLEACGCQHLRTSGHQLCMTTGRLPRKFLDSPISQQQEELAGVAGP